MFDLSGANLIGNLIFSSIGFGAFIYGKKQSLWKPMAYGFGLMALPFLVANTPLMYAVGFLGTGALLFFRE